MTKKLRHAINVQNQSRHHPVRILFMVFAFHPVFAKSLSINHNISAIYANILSKAFTTKPKSIASQISTPSSSSPKMSLGAWRCHGTTNQEMISNLATANIITSAQVKSAMLLVDRSDYSATREGAYQDAPERIGYGQTISAPHMHAHALEEILPTLTAKSTLQDHNLKILDVGCGSGYLTTVLGRLVDQGQRGPIHPLSKGHVFGIDIIPGLVQLSETNIRKANEDLLNSGTITLSVASGWNGLPTEAPFDAIHVGAAAEKFPHKLMMQLSPDGGVMVIPIGPDGGYQHLYRVERLRDNKEFNESDFLIRMLLGVRYVPLVH